MGKYTVEQFAHDAFTVFDPKHRVIVRNITTLDRAKSIITAYKAYEKVLDVGSRVVYEEDE